MAKLKYFGSHISDNIIRNDQGFIICLDVPLARTGWQTYLGRELGEETQREHGIADDQKVEVYRPAEEVFHPDTMKSFEAQCITNLHPSGNRFVDSENVLELSRGHVQNIRRSPELENGEEVMIGDLVVQEAGLVNEVLEKIKREISCGYDYKLRLRSDGNFEQYEIRGNHVAVVPKGRAGSAVRINDSAATEERTVLMSKPANTSWTKFLSGLGFKHFAMDAKPEEVAEALDELGQKEEKVPEKEDMKAKDAETAEEKKAEKSEEKREEKKEEKASDRAKDAKGKDTKMEQLKKLIMEFLDEEEDEPEHADDKKGKDAKPKAEDKKSRDNEKESEEEEEEEKHAEDAELEPLPELPEDEKPKNPIPGADAAMTMDVLRRFRPYVAKSNDPRLVKEWNRAYDEAKEPKRASTRGGYSAFTDLKRANDAEQPLTFEDRSALFQKNLDAANIRSQKGGN